MPNNMLLTAMTAALAALGKAVVFRAAYWDGVANLALTHLGNTEGDVTVAVNEAYSHLTLPEQTGPAKHESYAEGEDPVVTLPLFLANRALRDILTPTGNASGGYGRRRPVTKHTLVLFPEELFYNEGDDAYAQLSYDGTAWTLGGDALTSRQAELLDLSMWFWRGYFTKPPISFKHADGGKTVDAATFQVMHDATKPDGQMLYTLGDPADALIDIHPAA